MRVRREARTRHKIGCAYQAASHPRRGPGAGVGVRGGRLELLIVDCPARRCRVVEAVRFGFGETAPCCALATPRRLLQFVERSLKLRDYSILINDHILIQVIDWPNVEENIIAGFPDNQPQVSIYFF